MNNLKGCMILFPFFFSQALENNADDDDDDDDDDVSDKRLARERAARNNEDDEEAENEDDDDDDDVSDKRLARERSMLQNQEDGNDGDIIDNRDADADDVVVDNYDNDDEHFDNHVCDEASEEMMLNSRLCRSGPQNTSTVRSVGVPPTLATLTFPGQNARDDDGTSGEVMFEGQYGHVNGSLSWQLNAVNMSRAANNDPQRIIIIIIIIFILFLFFLFYFYFLFKQFIDSIEIK